MRSGLFLAYWPWFSPAESGPQVSEGWYGVPFTDNLRRTRDAVRPWLAFYLGSMGAPEKNFYVDLAGAHGHGDAARRVQQLMLGGDRAGAATAETL
jgi:hypothetical protein